MYSLRKVITTLVTVLSCLLAHASLLEYRRTEVKRIAEPTFSINSQTRFFDNRCMRPKVRLYGMIYGKLSSAQNKYKLTSLVLFIKELIGFLV